MLNCSKALSGYGMSNWNTSLNAVWSLTHSHVVRYVGKQIRNTFNWFPGRWWWWWWWWWQWWWWCWRLSSRSWWGFCNMHFSYLWLAFLWYCKPYFSVSVNRIFRARKVQYIQTLPMYLLEIVNDISVQILQGAEWTPFSFYSRSVLRTTATDSANFTCQVRVLSFSL